MRIIGVMRLCNEFVEEIDLTVGTLAAFCDGVCFLMDHVTHPSVLSAVKRCRNLLGTEEYTEESWNHYHSSDQAYRLADKFKPDWVVMQDQDELLPFSHLRQGLEAISDTGNNTLVLPVIHCWGTPFRIVWPRLNRTGDHGKAYRGSNPDFAIAGGPGFCLPINAKTFFWSFPYRHLGFMTEECRARRLNVPVNRTRIEEWGKSEPPLFPYRDDWTIDEWNKLEVNLDEESKVDIRSDNSSEPSQGSSSGDLEVTG